MPAEGMVGSQDARDRVEVLAEGVDAEVGLRTKEGERKGEKHPAGTGCGRRAADKARSHRLAPPLAGVGTRSDRRTSSERTATDPTEMVVVGGQDDWTHARLADPARGRVMCKN